MWEHKHIWEAPAPQPERRSSLYACGPISLHHPFFHTSCLAKFSLRPSLKSLFSIPAVQLETLPLPFKKKYHFNKKTKNLLTACPKSALGHPLRSVSVMKGGLLEASTGPGPRSWCVMVPSALTIIKTQPQVFEAGAWGRGSRGPRPLTIHRKPVALLCSAQKLPHVFFPV